MGLAVTVGDQAVGADPLVFKVTRHGVGSAHRQPLIVRDPANDIDIAISVDVDGDARMLAEDFGRLVQDRRSIRPDVVLVEIKCTPRKSAAIDIKNAANLLPFDLPLQAIPCITGFVLSTKFLDRAVDATNVRRTARQPDSLGRNGDSHRCVNQPVKADLRSSFSFVGRGVQAMPGAPGLFIRFPRRSSRTTS